MTPEEAAAAYERGRSDGETRERLAAHDRHFVTINGQLAKVATELHEMTLAIRQLGDRQESVLLASRAAHDAVKEAEAGRRASLDQRWSVWQKIFAVLAAVATVVGLYYSLRR